MPFRQYFLYTRAQRLGLISFFFLLILLQCGYWFLTHRPPEPETAAAQQWLQLQPVIDSARLAEQQRKPKIFPFNPNFISDFKGYQWGMSITQIDRLHAFRDKGRFVNSAKEFQQLTGVSDSLLNAMAPYFKFPDWVTKKTSRTWEKNAYAKTRVAIIDINEATKEDLKKVYGIGDGLSERILKEKEKYGAFVSMDQMRDIWGLSDEVIDKLNASFQVLAVPELKRTKINEASIKELMQFPLFRYAVAKSIVTYRSMNGRIESSEDLTKIPNFPVDKVKIIALYLEF